jgi:hypothetical protein
MTIPEFDPGRRAAFRTALINEVSRAKRPRRHRIWFGVGFAVILLASGAGGVATASFTTPPGTPVYKALTEEKTETFTESGSFDLGAPPPADANSISFRATCLSEGTFWVENYGGISCDSTDGDSTRRGTVDLSLWQQSTLELELEPGTEVRISAAYSEVIQTEWGVNAAGETYGAQKNNREADLAPAWATNGRTGYIRLSEAAAATFDPTKSTMEDLQVWLASPESRLDTHVPVYEADGKTIIGQYLIVGYDTQERIAQEMLDAGIAPPALTPTE